MKRRSFLKTLSFGAAAASSAGALGAWLGGGRRVRAQASDRRFLFVVTATGGASIIDSFLPVREGDVSSAERAAGLVTYPDASLAQPSGSSFRCVKNRFKSGLFANGYELSDFVAAHHEDMAVVTVENTSVNHPVAQKRAITGAGIDGGRTIMEAVAERHGQGLILPNVNLATGGYLEPGDAEVSERARAEVVARADLFALAAHGYRGVPRAPSPQVVARARAARERLEEASPLRELPSALRTRYLTLRNQVATQLEDADLITKLMLLENGADMPLTDYDLAQSPDGARLRTVFPLLGTDRLQTQAALAFLLVKYGVSCTVTFGPGAVPTFLPGGDIIDTPIAFDFSHTQHPMAQTVMWSRITETLDGLIRLLAGEELGDGLSYWDRSLVYVATDFGRSKERPKGAEGFGTGHDLTNGNLFVSPLLRGNRVYGGVDPETCKPYGFDPLDGTPRPGTVMREGHLYSLVAQALDVDFRGRLAMDAVVRSTG